MKKLAFLIVILVLSFSLTAPWQHAETFSNNPTQIRQSFETDMVTDGASIPRSLNHLTSRMSKSIIQVFKGRNESVNVVLGSQEALTVMNVGFSTIIKPPRELEDKIDFNLLNLTKLVTDDYLQNNQTDVIVSMPSKHSLRNPAELMVQKKLVNEAHKIYTSRYAPSHVRFFAARLNYSILFQLAKSPYIDYIWLDRKFEVCLDQSVRIIKDPAVWANIESSFGRYVNGSGIKIAILDTGIDSTHPDFYFPNGTSKIAAAISFTGESIVDGYGHGTHCASIAAGTGAASGGQYVGVAPGSALLNVKVLDNQGKGLESWIISGIQWAVDNGADILSMSFGGTVTSEGTDPLSTVVNWATEQGTVCGVAAGNSGSQMYTVTSPGVADLAITVGASSKKDIVASFSSRGPTADYRIKPDVVAPGVDIIAARANGSNMGTPISQYYTKASGTSMATPHVAGITALLLDAHPSWSPITVKMALTNYAENIGSNVFEQGSGRVDACKSATASIIGNSSMSFGRVHLNKVYEHIITFKNLGTTTLHMTLNSETWFIENKMHYQAVSLNSSSLYIASGETRKVELRLDTSVELPSGYFEGIVTATFDDGSIRIPFFFCILSLVNCEVVDENGSKLMAAFVILDAGTGETKGYSSECTDAQFTVSPGEYIVQAMNVYGWNPSTKCLDATYSFLVHQEFSIGLDETKYLQLSLASAYKLRVRSTDLTGSSLQLKLKQLLTPYYYIGYFSEIGTFASQYLYLTNIGEYVDAPCYFGFMGFSQEDIRWFEDGVLASEVDTYFIGWDLSGFGVSIPDALEYVDSELATFDVENFLPTSSSITTIWFNQIAGMWQSGLWCGFQTNPGIKWRIHVLPCQFKESSSANWAEMEWSCIYALSEYPDESAEYFVIDRHFEPVTRGEVFSYSMGKTPLLPQSVYDSAPYYGSGLFIPYYPLRVQKNLFLEKTDWQATKRIEVVKDGSLICNETKLWAQQPISITDFLQSHGYGLYSFAVKTGTNMNYSSQNVAKYVINYTSSSTDLVPPFISKIDCSPCFTGNEYSVDMELADNDKLCNVSLLYLLDDDPWVPSNLNDLGNGCYSTSFALSSTTESVSLAVEATDRNGNAIWFSTKPAARRGYRTRVDATLNAGRIFGKLTVVGGALVQPVYLRVKSDENVMYTRTDVEGNFEFTVPQSMLFPVEIEMVNMGPYEGSSCVISKSEVHDVAITKVVPSKMFVSGIVYIYVTVMNQGDSNETFNVTAYYNTSSIATETVTLSRDDSTIITFMWNTTGLAEYQNYVISAEASVVPGEIDIDDNTLVNGVVKLVHTGDVNGDGKVQIDDILAIALIFGSNYPDPLYDANLDINCDGQIRIDDVFAAVVNFGWTRP